MSEECETCTNNVDGGCILDWGCCYTPKREEKAKILDRKICVSRSKIKYKIKKGSEKYARKEI